MERAVAAGADAIELDVHATADGHVVVCHDATVDRTTDGHGAISTLPLAHLRELDNAHWFAPGADVSPGTWREVARIACEAASRGRIARRWHQLHEGVELAPKEDA